MSQRKKLRMSRTKALDYQRCEQLYFYKYVKRIRRKDKPVAPQMGTILHSYLEDYYRGLGELTPLDSHEHAKQFAIDQNLLDLKRAANILRDMGQDQAYNELVAVPTKVRAIGDAYYRARGKMDAERFEVLMIEQYMLSDLDDDIETAGVADMVTRDKRTGTVNLWEHKSATNEPAQTVRLLDLQTVIYDIQLENLHDIRIESVIWNYLRTKPPGIPKLLKKGDLSRDKRLDTTWETYLAEIMRLGLDPQDYTDVHARLRDAEKTVFFPRHDQEILASSDLILNDYYKTALNIQAAEACWEEGSDEPIRAIAWNCNRCEFHSICSAALLGGDEEDAIRLRYVVDEHRNRDQKELYAAETRSA